MTSSLSSLKIKRLCKSGVDLLVIVHVLVTRTLFIKKTASNFFLTSINRAHRRANTIFVSATCRVKPDKKGLTTRHEEDYKRSKEEAAHRQRPIHRSVALSRVRPERKRPASKTMPPIFRRHLRRRMRNACQRHLSR